VRLRSGGSYLLLFLIVWLVALQAQNTILFEVVWGLVGLYCANALWTSRATAALRVRRTFPQRAYTGAEILLETRLHNTGLLPILWAELHDAIPQELTGDVPPASVLSLGPRAELRIDTRLTCSQRGYYRIGPMDIRVADPLGLSEGEFTSPEEHPLIVYPRVVPLRRLHLPSPSALAVLPSRTPLFEDPARIVGVREYSPTDSLRKVHWSATARMGELMVKEFEYGMSRSTMLCLDLSLPHYEPRDRVHATELAIVVAASLASHAVTREHLEIGLRVEGSDPLWNEQSTLRIPPRADSHNLMGILELLARIRTVRTADFAAALRDEARRLPWGTTIVAITGSESSELSETLLHLKRGGHAVTLIVVSRQSLPHIPSSIPLRRVWQDEELAVGRYDRTAW
jgi:uncharacterized protein (DUF58 family)